MRPATGDIGKWHVYGSPDGQYGRRRAMVPRAYQMGFDYWKAFEWTHDYWNSPYFFNADPTPQQWAGDDAFAQSRDAANYIRDHAGQEQPFLLLLSWGPPHFPLETAPPEYRQRSGAVDDGGGIHRAAGQRDAGGPGTADAPAHVCARLERTVVAL